jgi:hypothetical protein
MCVPVLSFEYLFTFPYQFYLQSSLSYFILACQPTIFLRALSRSARTSTRSSVHEKSPHISIKVIILFPFPFFRVHLICLVGVVLHQDSSMVHPSWTTDYIMTLESLPFHLEFVTSSLLPSDKGLNYHHRPSFNPSNPNTLVYPVSYQNDN